MTPGKQMRYKCVCVRACVRARVNVFVCVSACARTHVFVHIIIYKAKNLVRGCCSKRLHAHMSILTIAYKAKFTQLKTGTCLPLSVGCR